MIFWCVVQVPQITLNLRALFRGYRRKTLDVGRKYVLLNPLWNIWVTSFQTPVSRKEQKLKLCCDANTIRHHQSKSFLGEMHSMENFCPIYRRYRTAISPHSKRCPVDLEREGTKSFHTLKKMLCADKLLVTSSDQDVSISCDASDVGIGCVLFHRFKDGSEKPISSRRQQAVLQRRCKFIKLKAFSSFCNATATCGRKFIRDHHPNLFLWHKEYASLATNRLARWALTLNQCQYEIEYRNTKQHGNADAEQAPSRPWRRFW